ncbi:MAG: Smr/MutS family protein [Deltaproteobacteria bacterium]|nr:Smr/MutS family protein [Deltaproteobacteria bacterium]
MITGANTGGKTVALKTLGLLTLMAQCGIPIPAAEGSEVSLVNKIFADIGDEQSLRDNLSTFSAWVQAVSKILTEADPSSLVLLDEVGGGTDPSEGAALTMALLDGLRERGSKTVVTTHLQLLKGYGAVHPDVVNVSVEFNRDTLQPTYRLIYGRPGDSYALLMARKWGLPPELVEKAEAYLGEDNQKIGELLQSLDQTQQEMEAKLKAYERMKQEAGELREKASALIEETKREKERVISKAQEETGTLIRQARENLRKVINEFKAKGRTDVHRLQQEIQAEEEKISLSLGTLPAVPRSIPLARPHGKAKEGPLAGNRASIQYEVPNATRQLKLIGLRVEEALPLVDKAIDKAFLAGLPELEVIHGAGTGKLRQAIREYIGEHVLVKSFLPGGSGRGGDGVTRVAIAPSPKSTPARGGLARQKVRGVKG